MPSPIDAVVVGAGPNGLSAAIELARSGLEVRVLEGAQAVGGGARTEESTLPGFAHDLCSAVHPLAVGSPFLSSLPLETHGLEWVHSPSPLAHPLDDGRAILLGRDRLKCYGEGLAGDPDWDSLVDPFVNRWWDLAHDALGPLKLPRHPVLMLRFALRGLRSAEGLARSRLRRPESRALFAGLSAHSVLPLDRSPSGAVGLVLGVAGHAVGWPVPRGGAGSIASALAGHLGRLGGTIETGRPVTSLDQLPRARAVLLDLTPRQVVAVAGDRLPPSYRGALDRYRYGPAAWKVDWALDGPIPWAAPECTRAITLHLGGSSEEIARAEAAPWENEVSDRPFVLLAQPSLFDPTRAPEGKHTAWGYCHVPHGWEDAGVTERIEKQVERYAPGFRDRILARSVWSPADLEARNPNLVGGDIGGGVQDLGQLFFRPVTAFRPYRTPVEGIYLCSSSTPPGGGVHGMCGYYAARTALRDLFA
ncbi:MAG: phytoene desaturase family protein [Longimicrobiales bacterium]